ncbi:MAG: DUF488 domain-containing protein [Alphaproteobacteria bacterium]|nr:DUF488 domain-containing protein [Alphaproteobacteria bacterium]
MSDALSLFTIGHSTHSFEWFLALLSGAGIEAVADVRTAPVSRFCPQFNKARLDEALRAAGLSYAFLGKELGGRPDDPALYTNGIADFERMAKSAAFHKGIDRVIVQARERRLALMCSEKHPLDCHRCLLVGRALAARGAAVQHILSDGTQTEQREIEEHLLAGSEDDLFTPRAERLAAAYRARTRKVAFAKK